MDRRWFAALASGAIFGLGLAISGMTDPRVVQGFLDVSGRFDPTLIFVMGGAVGVTMIAFHFVLRLPGPLLDSRFQLPVNKHIDRKLVAGAAIFGIGWGLAGYCPGPALVNLAAGFREALYFVPAMVVGGLAYRWLAAGRN